MLLTVTDVATRGATVIVALLVARFFGPEEYGLYTVASALAGMALIPTILGFEQELTRRASVDRDRIGQAMLLCFAAIAVGAFVGSIALAGFLSLGTYPQQVLLYTGLIWLSVLLARLHLPFRHYSLALGRPELCATVQGIGTVAIITVTVLMILSGRSLPAIIAASVIVNGVVLARWWWIVPPQHRRGPVSAAALWQFASLSFPYGVSNVIWVLYFNIDSIILSLLRTEAEVGVYGAAFRIAAAAYTFAYAMTNTFTPLLFANHKNNKDDFGHNARRLLVTLALLGSLVCGGLFVVAQPLVELVLGTEYVASILVLQVLCAAMLVRFVNFGLCEILTTSNRQKLRLVLESSMLLANIVANLQLVPRFGAVGAAVACVVGELVLLAGVSVSVYRLRLLSRTRPASA
jgi:O-antigen/teichoic acid export membrane protein